MVGTVLVGVLVLVLAGCGCIVWAARGGPGWVRAVAAVTLGAGDLLRGAERRRRRRRQRERWLLGRNSSGEGGGDGS
ncbi:hypothetical protein AB0F71_13185 [Kitasatospora sp. NPDC028055]|uniref:hypothetical protein n=1 Tax=Kitasatospora sp. NPDC028055 TaxID=3155653 RepID=UPI0033C63F09